MCRALVALAAAVALAACAVPVGRVGFVTTRPVDDAMPRAPTPAARPAVARACMPVVVVFPAGRLPSLGTAIERALVAGRGTVLFDAAVRYEIAYVPLVGGRTCYVVEGRVE